MEFTRSSDHSGRVFITFGWVFLAILLLVTFQTKDIEVASDGTYYLLNANFISSGQGYTYGCLDSREPVPVKERGPIAPLFISLGLKFTPGKLLGPYLILRISYVVSIILVVILGSSLFSPKVGLTSGIFCVFYGFYQSRTSLIHLESLFIMWILLFVFFFWKGFTLEKKWLQALGGLALGVAYLTTEIAILFIPLPILSWLMIRSFRTRKRLKGVAFFYIAFIITLMPWALYLLYVHNSVTPILGRALSQFFHLQTIEKVVYTVGGGLSKQAPLGTLLGALWSEYLAGVSVLAPLWIMGWIWILVRMIWAENRAPYVLLALLALPFLIMLGGQVLTGTRQSQALVFHVISFLPLAVFIHECSERFSRFFTKRTTTLAVSSLLATFLILIIISLQIFMNPYPFGRFFKKLMVHDFSKGGRIFRLNEDNDYRQAHEIAQALISRNEKGKAILVDDYFLMNAIAFYAKDRYRLYSLPFAVFPPGMKRRHQRKYLEPTKDFRCPVLFLKNRAGGPRFPDVYRALTMEELKSLINSEDISFVVLSGKQPVYSIFLKIPWFQALPNLKLKQGKILRLASTSEIPLLPLETDSLTMKTLKLFASNDSHGFRTMAEHFFRKYLGWSVEQSFKFADEGILPSLCVQGGE